MLPVLILNFLTLSITMDFEAIPLDNKKYCTGQHQKNLGILRINMCCRNRKKCAWEINIGVIKMYNMCQDKRVCLKKEIKELEMTEHVCSRMYVCFTKGTCHFG